MATGTGREATSIDILLRLVPDSPDTVLAQLRSHPQLASSADTTGYSLLHAAASWNQPDLLRILVNDYSVDVNITDEEGETPLFVAETVAVAKCLVEDLGADPTITNEEGITAEHNALASMEDGGEWPLVADYLERIRTGGESATQAPPSSHGGDIGDASMPAGDGDATLRAPPPLPANVRINIGTMQEQPLEGENAPDPEFRRRIEELAARDDFHGEEGQRELKELVTQAVGGLADAANGRDVRQRTD